MRIRLLLLLGLITSFVSIFLLAAQHQKAYEAPPSIALQKAKSAKQIAHSKLYKQYGTGKKLTELDIPSGGIRVRRNTPLQGADSGYGPIALSEYLERLACDSELVVIGRVECDFITNR